MIVMLIAITILVVLSGWIGYVQQRNDRWEGGRDNPYFDGWNDGHSLKPRAGDNDNYVRGYSDGILSRKRL